MPEKKIILEKISDFKWRVPKEKGMRVSGILYANEFFKEEILGNDSLEQIMRTSYLPGLAGHVIAFPESCWGYGFCNGSVAAADARTGVICPAGAGYDINDGMRLLATDLSLKDIYGRLAELMDDLFSSIPSGVGSRSQEIEPKAMTEVMLRGAEYAVEKGCGWPEDIQFMENKGCNRLADPSKVSEKAIARGIKQMGTIGSGNSFIEIDVVDEVYDPVAAGIFGLSEGQVAVFYHTGSRGFGYQVHCDYYDVMDEATVKYRLDIPDKLLSCAPLNSKEAKDYTGAMAAAENFAWANRQCLTNDIRKSFERVFGASPESLGMRTVYDVAHSAIRFEEHFAHNKKMKLCVHRKGSSRFISPGSPELPGRYKDTGSPVFVAGNMEQGSYVVTGTGKAESETFASLPHGSGRRISRNKAMKASAEKPLLKQFSEKGIVVRCTDLKMLTEELPVAYKNIDETIEILEGAGLAKKVAKLRPLGVIKS